MLRGNVPKKPKGKPYTMAESDPKATRKAMGLKKEVQAAKNMDTGGDDAMNIMPTFEEMARKTAASD